MTECIATDDDHSVSEVERRSLRRGLCGRHYRRWLRHGDFTVAAVTGVSGGLGLQSPSPVDFPCDHPVKHARGMCQRCYTRWRRYDTSRPSCCTHDCGSPAYALGLCYNHYRSARSERKERAPRHPCTECGLHPGGQRSGLCDRCYHNWYNRNVRRRRPKAAPKPAPEPRIEFGEWITRGDGVTVVHWPKGVECPICDAVSAQVA